MRFASKADRLRSGKQTTTESENEAEVRREFIIPISLQAPADAATKMPTRRQTVPIELLHAFYVLCM